MYLVGRLGAKCTFNAYLSTKYDFTTAELGISKGLILFRYIINLYFIMNWLAKQRFQYLKRNEPYFHLNFVRKIESVVTYHNKQILQNPLRGLNVYSYLLSILLLYVWSFFSFKVYVEVLWLIALPTKCRKANIIYLFL